MASVRKAKRKVLRWERYVSNTVPTTSAHYYAGPIRAYCRAWQQWQRARQYNARRRIFRAIRIMADERATK